MILLTKAHRYDNYKWSTFNRAMVSIIELYNSKYGPYDVTVLTDIDINETTNIRTTYKQLIFNFVNVSEYFSPNLPNFKVFENITKFSKDLKLGWSCARGAYEWTLDYLHMLRFRTIQMFNLWPFYEYDYTIQLDADACFTKVDKDILEEMVRYNKTILFYLCTDDPTCTETLYSTIELYLAAHNISWKHKDKFKDPNVFQATLLAFKNKWFTPSNEELWKLWKVLDETGGFYWYRWAEQAVLLAAISIFMDINDVASMSKLVEIRHYYDVMRPSNTCPHNNYVFDTLK